MEAPLGELRIGIKENAERTAVSRCSRSAYAAPNESREQERARRLPARDLVRVSLGANRLNEIEFLDRSPAEGLARIERNLGERAPMRLAAVASHTPAHARDQSGSRRTIRTEAARSLGRAGRNLKARPRTFSRRAWGACLELFPGALGGHASSSFCALGGQASKPQRGRRQVSLPCSRQVPAT